MSQTGRREVAVFYGTRSEAVRLAPVVSELRRRGACLPHVVTAGRHRAVVRQVNELFGIVPDHEVGLLRRGYSLNDVLSVAARGFSEYIDAHPVDAVVVQGDSGTAFAGALTAFHRGLPVVHVEAGLSTGDLHGPFPGEGTRRFISAIAARHCVPTALAARNLLRERVPEHQVTVTGSTVIDALMHTASRAVQVTDPVIEATIQARRRLVLVSPHHLEFYDGEVKHLAGALVEVAERFPEVLVVVPLPADPRVREVIVPTTFDTPNILLTDSLSYVEFVRVLSRATVVITNSASIQQEALAFGLPVVATSDATERPELVSADGIVLVGTPTRRIVDALTALLSDDTLRARTAAAASPLGDGYAASRIVDVIDSLFARR